MSAARNLIVALRANGWKIWVDDGQLRYRAPRTDGTPDQLSMLQRLKPQVVALLLDSRHPGEPELTQRERLDYEPLTFSQQAYLEDSFTWGKVGNFHIHEMRTCATATRIIGPLNLDALRWSVQVLVRRHETLRTKIVASGATHAQQVYEGHQHELEFLDISSSCQLDIHEKSRQLVDAIVYEPTGPAFKIRLLKLSDQEHILAFAMHHMISDAVSIGVFAHELTTLYEYAHRSARPSLPPLSIQYADFAVWQQQYKRWWNDAHGRYWQNRLADPPHKNFQISNENIRPDKLTLAYVEIQLGSRITTGLRDLARGLRTTLPMAVLAVYVAVLCLWQRKRDWILRFVIDGRDRPELEKLIGYVASVLFLRIRLRESDTFITLLRETSREFQAAYCRNDYGLLHVSAADAAWKHAAFVNWIPRPDDTELIFQSHGALGQLRSEPFPITSHFSKCEYEPTAVGIREPEVVFLETASGISGILSHPRELVSSNTMKNVAGNLQRLAETLVERPHIHIRSLIYEG